jgi:acyl carrier protein
MNIEQELITYFRDNIGVEVTPETLLLEGGVIDSMGATDLVAFVVQTFQVELDMDDLTLENFGTIADIKNLITCKKGKS